MAKAKNIWTQKHVEALAPDERSIDAAEEVLEVGGFGAVEPTADGRGWWVVCEGISGVYQVSARLAEGGTDFDCECTCPSPKYPCKHALALLLYLVDHPELRTEAEAPKVAASDFEALLRAVFANPEEDTPRLIFADFLEENDQTERAALIRYQCEDARLKPNSKRKRELAKLIKPLLAKLKKQIEPMPEGLTYEVRRGFMRIRGYMGALGDPGALPARFAKLFREGWVESLDANAYYFGIAEENERAEGLIAQVGELNAASAYPLAEEGLVALVAGTAAARTTGRLARVIVHKRNQQAFDQLVRAQRGETVAVTALDDLDPERGYAELTPSYFDLLLRAGRFSGATRLTLSSTLTIGDAELSALLATADLSELRELRLDGWPLTRTGVRALANSKALGRLTELAMELCPIGSDAGGDGIPALASASGLRGLEVLRLVECDLTDADAVAVVNSRSLPKLQYLELSANYPITASGVAAVLASKNVPHLSILDLQAIRFTDAEQLPLVLDAPDRPRLSVTFDQFTAHRAIEKGEVIVELEPRPGPDAKLFGKLAKCAGAKRVTQFSAQRLMLGAAQMKPLAAGFDPERLWLLDLTDNLLQNDGASALAEQFADFALQELKLSGCRIQSTGVAALVKSPLFANLRALDLSRNVIGKAGASALLKADVPANLKELGLTDCRLSADEKKRLKAKYGSRAKV